MQQIDNGKIIYFIIKVCDSWIFSKIIAGEVNELHTG